MKKFMLYCHLEKALEKRDITPYKLAKDTGERIGTIYKLVNNKDLNISRVPLSLIANICGYLNITLDELFEVKEYIEE
ncbi:hypothetical protein SD70_26080 [Gordoniibacillus kamchatkensis]|uniref:HTH cro/C1-type domain-containing protein n=1 Tax=Gordoniibacillus kamchatkensis TaxID=1590651 RepID=A0ABR5ABZ0_9BACL|nr:helix-turn-helix transcriptional regulator [Paenibacillus sp. VKM B-2647]KIL38507.1 hypothetical protein SD70_26080 [Paenibacillus sp. VKM B-2647]